MAIGNVVAPATATVPKQEEWWNTGTGVLGRVTDATATGYNPATMTAAGYNAATANAAGYEAPTWNVTNDQTVQGQLAGVLAQGSPIMESAKTSALQGANARGVLNSSMAIGAGQKAVIDSAMPIATADANTFATAGQYNTGVLANQRQFNASNQQQVNLANQGAENTARQTSAGWQQQAGLSNQTARNAASEFGSAATNTASLNNAQAANALQQQSNLLRQQAAQGNQQAAIDLIKLDTTSALQAQMANADAQTRVELANIQGSIQTNLANIEADYKTLIQTSATAGDLYRSTLSAISPIINDVNMDAASKAAAINGLFSRMGAAMNVVGSINGVDVTDLLDFGTVTVQ